MRLNRRVLGAFALGLIGPVALFWLTQAGNMEPPGSPASTMKSMDVVEPRTPIYNSDLPLTITSSGSYYLAEDIPVANGGITVDAGNVTIDLMGFSLCGPGGRAIFAATAEHVTVTNGTVCNWANCAIELADHARVHNVQAQGSGGGICVGPDSVVTGCVASDNNLEGFVLKYGSVIDVSTASDNGGDGIMCDSAVGGGACSITNCTVNGNTRYGINSNLGSVIQNCVVLENGSVGIQGNFSTFVHGCTVRANVGHGIQVHQQTIVRNNNCVGNGTGGDGAGIYVTGSTNRIDSNNFRGNTRGLDVDAAGNFIVRNSAYGNGTNYDIVAGNNWASNPPTTAGPWDNLDP
jgi:hypothetical protein